MPGWRTRWCKQGGLALSTERVCTKYSIAVVATVESGREGEMRSNATASED